ncbi:MAG: hypothetical protein M1822_000694 [Bathelium mastoideum]|nr:MAG: hypothetical protein M1822_000694 [Bathelium mastoideum]
MALSKAPELINKVRFLILSDTHGLTLNNLPEADVVLHCGDLTEQCSVENLRSALRFLSSIKAELRLVLAGNHDVLLDAHCVDSHAQPDAHKEALRIMSEASDITYLEEGIRKFTLKRGPSFTVHASPYTPSQYGANYGLHAFQYASNEDRYNPSEAVNGFCITPSHATNVSTSSSAVSDFPNVDIVMTHGPPKYILDRVKNGSSVGCEHLRRAICRAKPRLHCFGHIHESYGAQRIAWKSNTTKEDLEEVGAELLDVYDDDVVPLPQAEPDGLMKNSCRRRGFARISERSLAALYHGKQTLCINAAVKTSGKEPSNAPWLVDLRIGKGS